MRIELHGKKIWVNFHHLYCFYVIGNTGGIAAASKDLGIGASALSIQMKQLEAVLGAEIFMRTGRKLELNEQGRLLFSYCKEIFRLGGEMIQALGDRPELDCVHVQIGALDNVAKHLTVSMAEFAIDKLGCAVTLLEGKLGALMAELLEHRLDIMVTNIIPKAAPGQIVTKKIAQMPLWVVGGKAFAKLRRNFPRSLHEKPFVLPTGDSRVRQEIEDYFVREKVTPQIKAETQDLITQKMLAIRNVGLMIAPEFAVSEYVDRGELLLLGKLPEGYSENIYLITAQRRIENPAAAFLMESFTVSA